MNDVKTKPDAKGKQPLVSCIIIFLNGEEFLEEAIESVRSQTLNDWELIMVVLKMHGATLAHQRIIKQLGFMKTKKVDLTVFGHIS